MVCGTSGQISILLKKFFHSVALGVLKIVGLKNISLKHWKRYEGKFMCREERVFEWYIFVLKLVP